MSVTLTVGRRALGELIGPYGVYDCSGGSATTAIIPAAFKSTELPPSHLATAWLFFPLGNGVRQRRIKADGLDQNTATVTLDAELSSTIVNGSIVEISARLPPTRETTAANSMTTVMGLRECLNAGARDVLVPHTFTVTLVDGQYDYPNMPSWLDRASRLLEIRQHTAFGTTRLPTWRTYRLRTSATNTVLHVDQPFRIRSGSYSAELSVLRPADTLISGADSTVGLVNENDTVGLSVRELVAVSLPYAYLSLRATRPAPERAIYDALYQEARADAVRVMQGAPGGAVYQPPPEGATRASAAGAPQTPREVA